MDRMIDEAEIIAYKNKYLMHRPMSIPWGIIRKNKPSLYESLASFMPFIQ